MKNKSKSNINLKKKKICILSDCFVPTRNSAAGMIYNLSKSLSEDGAFVTCIHSGFNPNKYPEKFASYDLKNLNFIITDFMISFRDKSIFLRFIFEIILASILTIKVLISFKKIKETELLIWYGPSAFLWVPALIIKKIARCSLYYILRDIFPDWLFSTKVIKNKFLFFILKFITHPQYIIPDRIGVESNENISLVLNKIYNKKKIEVLYNWPSINLRKKPKKNKIQLKKDISLKGVYSGSFSYAQGSEDLIKFLKNLEKKTHIHIDFFVKHLSHKRSFKKIFFKNLISEDKLVKTFQSYDYGVFSLNLELNTNNIPGKFVSYTQFGLPILCFANLNSTIAKLITKNNCGIVVDVLGSESMNFSKIDKFLKVIKNKNNFYSENSRKLHNKMFNIDNVKQKIGSIISDG